MADPAVGLSGSQDTRMETADQEVPKEAERSRYKGSNQTGSLAVPGRCRGRARGLLSKAKRQRHHSMGDARRLKREGCLRRSHAGDTPHSAPRAWRLARRGEAFGMCPLLQSTGSPLLQSMGSPLLQSTPVRRWCVSVLQSTGSPLLQSTASPRCVQVVITIHP